MLARTVTHAARRPRSAPGRGRGSPPAGRAGVRDRRARRPRLPGGEGARSQRHRLGRARVAAAPDHRQPRAGRPAQGGLGLRPADRAGACSRRRASSRRAASPGTPRSASSRSTAGCDRSPARSRRPRAHDGTARNGSSARPSPAPRSRSRGSSRCRCGTSPRRSRTSAASATRRTPEPPRGRAARRRRARSRRRPRPGAGAPRARDRGRGRPQPAPRRAAGRSARRCSPAGCPGILPPLDDDAALEVTRIHSIAGLLRAGGGLIAHAAVPGARTTRRRPAAIVGGGASPRPGEATLAHHGVLLLDELPEFARPVLEALRQPLEDGTIAVARVGGRARLPGPVPARRDDEPVSRAAARGDPARRSARARRRSSTATATGSRARCSTASTSWSRCRGRGRSSSPRRAGEPSRRRPRPGGRGAGGARPSPRRLARDAEELLGRAVERLPLSARGRARVARVARTIAALAGSRAHRPRARRRGALLPVARRSSDRRERARTRRCSPRPRRPRVRTAARSPRVRRASPPPSTRPQHLAGTGLGGIPLARPLGSVLPGRCCASIHDPPPGLFLRGAAPRSCSPSRRSRSSAPGAAATTAHTSPGRSGASSPPPGSSSSRASPAASTAGPTAARWTPARPTVAVLGCGIDRDYPRAHSALAAQIADRGLLVSEYPPGVAPAPWRFPARNRIVAGLAGATVVVEARERSGALITADLALEEGREVLAVPGEITSALSSGTNAAPSTRRRPRSRRPTTCSRRSGSSGRPSPIALRISASPRSPSSRPSRPGRRPPTSWPPEPDWRRAPWQPRLPSWSSPVSSRHGRECCEPGTEGGDSTALGSRR